VGPGRLEQFEASRQRLFGLAYRLLGEATEAEDVVQDAYLRWMNSHDVEVPEAWLRTVVTNLCLNRLTSARARRESYVGPWLPEPVVTGDGALGPLETVEQRESVSLGVLVLLERLTPAERAVFVLREAFGHSHREIAKALAVTEANSRQLYRRARDHVGEPRRRFAADHRDRERILGRLFAASADGDVAGLERLLAEDVVAWADGGGVAAARRPVVGRDKVVRYLLGLGRRPEVARLRMTVAEVNGELATVHYEGDQLRAILVPEVVGGVITALRLVVNPDKLAFAARQLR
jgi:RNA polymerase sigma factor (sigma-70 family)